jgi:2-hydroxymuconate-semialdehyde hydrolase
MTSHGRQQTVWNSCDGELDLPTAKTCFVDTGEGAPLVLVHGLMAYSFSWRKNIPALSKHYRVLAPDLAGCGYSGPVKEGRHSVEIWSRQLEELLDALHLRNVYLVGSSAGGAVAVDFAARHADRVTKLVLVGSVNPFSRRVVLLSSMYASTGLPDTLLKLLVEAAPMLLPWLFAHRYYAKASRITPETLPGFVQPLSVEKTVPMLRDVISEWQPRRMLQQLPRLVMPTLLVWGAEDKLVPPSCIPELQAVLPNAQVEMISETGHLVFEECPEEFNEILLRFLSKPASGR